MGKHKLTPELMDIIAERFKALGEPARLQILDALRDGEATVTELVDATGLGQANVSKHLRLLHAHGCVSRRKAGVSVYYTLAESVDALCDIMTHQLKAQTTSRRRALTS